MVRHRPGRGRSEGRTILDVKAGLIEPKSTAGRRKVPITAILRDYLLDHRLDPREGHLVFGRPDGTPFATSSTSVRARNTWKRAKLNPITLHECRHTFASLMIAAGVNPKALQTFMGHSSITVTLTATATSSLARRARPPSSSTPILRKSHERARSASVDDGDCGEVGTLAERS